MVSIYSKPETVRYKAPAQGDAPTTYTGSICGGTSLVYYGFTAQTGVRSTDYGSLGKLGIPSYIL